MKLHPILLKLSKRALLRFFKNPLVLASTASLGVRIGKEVYRLKLGEIDPREFRARTGTHVGSISGGVFGAAAGAAALAALPGVGPVLGAFAGGLVGETIGARLGRNTAERAESLLGAKGTSPPPGARTKKRSL